jgi:acetylornithine deacetylase/succinyl-diaminopimelate desuccinylase-like protein
MPYGREVAGHAENALPQSATVTVNCRLFPGVEISEVQDSLQRIAGNGAFAFRVVRKPVKSPPSPHRRDVMSAVKNAVHLRYPDIPIIATMRPGETDRMNFRNAGFPTYGITGYFIRTGDDFAHGLNEHAPVKSLFAALEHWHMILHELAGS